MKNRKKFTNDVIISLIIRSARESFLNTYNFIATFFGVTVVVFLMFNQNYGFPFWQSIFIGVVIYFFCFTIIFIKKAFVNFVKEYSRLNEFNVYGEAIKKLSTAFSILHNLGRSQDPTFEEIIKSFEEFCTIVKQVYDEITMSQNSVSIKIVLKPKATATNDHKVITLCRDIVNRNDREPKNGNIEHTITKNTCFHHFYINIGRKRGKYYINNDLLADTSYKNSSFEYYGKLPSTCNTVEDKIEHWTLPYKSEIVAPIAPLNSSDPTKELIGFICVDNSEQEPFLEKYDTHLLLGVTDGVYNLMKSFYDKGILK